MTLLLIWTLGTAWAHPALPAGLRVDAAEDGTWTATFRVPDALGTAMEPRWPADCAADEAPRTRDDTYHVQLRRWTLRCDSAPEPTVDGLRLDEPPVLLTLADGSRKVLHAEPDLPLRAPGCDHGGAAGGAGLTLIALAGLVGRRRERK